MNTDSLVKGLSGTSSLNATASSLAATLSKMPSITTTIQGAGAYKTMMEQQRRALNSVRNTSIESIGNEND